MLNMNMGTVTCIHHGSPVILHIDNLIEFSKQNSDMSRKNLYMIMSSTGKQQTTSQLD